MPHSGTTQNAFIRINTRAPEAVQSPISIQSNFWSARTAPSLDSDLLVPEQISYRIQIWIRVYRLYVGFGIALGKTWRSAW
jgi:hypothetical protein